MERPSFLSSLIELSIKRGVSPRTRNQCGAFGKYLTINAELHEKAQRRMLAKEATPTRPNETCADIKIHAVSFSFNLRIYPSQLSKIVTA